MSNQMKARPTEYKGVRFRSKSEAVFARSLDLAGYKWAYEPCEIGGHLWDFYAETISSDPFILESEDGGWHCIGRQFHRILIEYKPVKPTASYMEALWAGLKHEEGLNECFEHRFHRRRISAAVIYGSPWNPASDHCIYMRCLYPDSRECRFLNREGMLAKEYRFDLDGAR